MRLLISPALLILAVASLTAQQSALPVGEAAPAPAKVESTAPPPFRLFNLVSEDSLQEKMDQYGASGYRFAGWATAEGGATQVLMEVATGGPFEYAIASGTMFKHRLVDGMNELGARSFRYLPQTLRMTKGGSMFSPPSYSVVMEKSPDGETCEYRLVNPVQLKNVAKDIATGLTEGFRPITATQEQFVVIERCGKGVPVPAEAAADMFHTVGWGNMKEREAKIAENTAGGYRVVTSGFGWRGNQPPNFFLLLERTGKTSPVYKYLVSDYKLPKKEDAPKDQPGEFTKALNEVSRTGYRLVGPPIGRIHFTGFATPWSELSGLLEKSEEKYEYQLVIGEDTPALARKLAELRDQGYRVVPGGLLDGDVAVLERKVSAGGGQ